MSRKQPRDKATGRYKAKIAPAPRKRRTLATSGPSAPVNPFRMTAQDQGWLTGHGPGWWISDHLEELRHFVSWIYVGVHKVAQQWAQATANVYDLSAQQDDFAGMDGLGDLPGRGGGVMALGKHLRRLRNLRQKAVAPDAPADHRTPIPDHPAARKLEQPNPLTSGRIFRYQVACQIRLTGGCYIWEVSNQFGEPEHLWCVPRGWCRPNPRNGQYPDGYFTVTPVFNTFTSNLASPSLTTWNIPFEQMIQVGYPDPLYPGEFKSPLSACSRIIDIMEQTDTATWSSFVNAVKPSLVFNIDPKSGTMPTQEQITQFLEQLDAFKAGANNHGKILFMLGLTAQQLMSGPSELDFVNGRDQNRRNVFGLQGVAEVVAGFGGSTSYSEAAVGAKTTIEFSVAPDLDIFADKLTKRWQRVWGEDFQIVFDPKNYDDPTLKLQRIDKVGQAFQAGVVSANEYRAELELPPLEDPIAEIPQLLLQPMLAGPGSPEAGVAGAEEEDPYAAFADMDFGDGEATETDTGMANADQTGAPGRLKRFSLNGNGKHLTNGSTHHG